MGSYEIVEHTADVGIRARGETLEETFVEATLGLLDILGAWRPEAEGQELAIEVEANDHAALLADWLGEVLYLQDARDIVVARVDVAIEDTRAHGRISAAPRAETLAGTAVKAITYHQLKIEHTDDGWVAQVYVDV